MLQEFAEVKAFHCQHGVSFNMTHLICALLFYATLIHLGIIVKTLLDFVATRKKALELCCLTVP